MSSATNDDRRIDGFSHGEIQRAATDLIASHGDKAPMVAAMKVQSYISKGNQDGERLWLRILAAVKVMRDAKPKGPLN